MDTYTHFALLTQPPTVFRSVLKQADVNTLIQSSQISHAQSRHTWTHFRAVSFHKYTQQLPRGSARHLLVPEVLLQLDVGLFHHLMHQSCVVDTAVIEPIVSSMYDICKSEN